MAVQPHKKLEKGHENTGNLRSDMEGFGVLLHNSQRNWFVTLYIYIKFPYLILSHIYIHTYIIYVYKNIYIYISIYMH